MMSVAVACMVLVVLMCILASYCGSSTTTNVRRPVRNKVSYVDAKGNKIDKFHYSDSGKTVIKKRKNGRTETFIFKPEEDCHLCGKKNVKANRYGDYICPRCGKSWQ